MIKLAQYNTLLRLGIIALLLLALNACDQPPPAEREELDLVAADSAAGRPTVAVDAERGTVYVAWVGHDGGQPNVYLSRLEAGTDSMSAPLRVNAVPGDAAGHNQAPAQVAVGPEATVYVTWIVQTEVPGRRFPATDIRLARSTDGGRTFEPAVTVNEAAGFPTSHHFHNLTVGPDGTVYVAWLDASERDRAKLRQEQQAGPPVVPVQDTGHQGHNHHGHEPDGLPGTELRVARSTDGGRTFGPSAVVAQGTCQCCRTALTVARDGTLYVAWRHIFDGNVRDMALARSTDGGQTFSPPVRIHADGWAIDGCPHAGPSLAVEGSDRLHVVWYTGVEGGAGVYYARSEDGGATFGPAEPLAPGVPVAQVASAAGGTRWIAWEDPLRDVIRFAHLEAGAPAGIDSLAGTSPSLAAARDWMALAWQDEAQARLHVSRPVQP